MSALVILMRRYWQPLLVLVLFAGLGGVYLYRGKMLELARAELSSTQGKLDDANQRIAAQNFQIEKWKAAAARQGRQTLTTQRAAAHIAAAAQSAAQAMLTVTVPAQCDAAVRWGAQQAASLAADWR